MSLGGQEGKGALSLSIATAEAAGATLILANDPDADRLAVAEKQTDGSWKIFSGNEIGTLLAHWEWVNWRAANPAADPSQVSAVFTLVFGIMCTVCSFYAWTPTLLEVGGRGGGEWVQ